MQKWAFIASETDTDSDPGETPDNEQNVHETNVANQLEHEVFDGPERVVRRIDIDLNVFTENVRSGLVESIVKVLEALGDVLASDSRINAKLLKDVQKPVCKKGAV